MREIFTSASGDGRGPREEPVIRLQVGARPDAATLVRRSLDPFRQRLDRVTFENVRLLTTELVTNAVRHAGLGPGEEIEVSASLLPDRVRVEVTDSGGGFVPPPAPKPRVDQTSGWGLFLVDRVADDWGVSHPPTRAWFEIRLSGNTASPVRG